jgi:tetratricopeptide (TPR) repeat protein
MVEKEELLERYEALGEEADFLAAKPLYERALTEAADARLLNEYGYLLECHGRRELRRAVELYERAIELDPGNDKPHYQLISARAGLLEPELPHRDLRAAPCRFSGRGPGARLSRDCLSEGACLRPGPRDRRGGARARA